MSSQDTFISHLIELRQRLVRVIVAVLAVCLCLLPWSREIYGLLAQPLLVSLPKGGQMIATDVIGPFLVPLKVTLLVGFVAVLPYVLYEAWAFIAPGLYAHEKRLVATGRRQLPAVPGRHVVAYFLVFPMVFKFMVSIARKAWRG
jgi:sec-independent protein translocase protein TatC